MTWFNPVIPSMVAATTKGDAAAPVVACVAWKISSEVLGTTNPITKTPPI